jgi:trimethylamine--corrinoid protein Co-methyltransferase
MAQGLIDFARAGQLSIVTPFTLMGAMAPITVAGAITLSHAECLAAITLTQLARPGAPVCYGTFTSNVDMKSGAPAFGTPTHFQASLAGGQMARMLGLPWRSAPGRRRISTTRRRRTKPAGALGLPAGRGDRHHPLGRLARRGLTVSYEKIVTDVEVLNMVAELCAGNKAGADEIGFANALSQVAPSGHFFAAPQTMERYTTEFYEPIVHDYANFGTWTERGRARRHRRGPPMCGRRSWPNPRLGMTPPDRLAALARSSPDARRGRRAAGQLMDTPIRASTRTPKVTREDWLNVRRVRR